MNTKGFIVIEETSEEVSVQAFDFQAHFIKLNEEYEVEKEMTVVISAVDENFEGARTQALNEAQSILRDLDGYWFFRLMNN